jgi:predicted secreted protein
VSIPTAVAIYFLIWWLTLFAVLPWGVRAQGEGAEPGSDPGAPRVPMILTKLIWTSVVSGVIFGALAYLYVMEWVTLDSLSALLRIPQFRE